MMATALDDRKLLTNLKKSRGVVKASLTRIHTFLENFNLETQAPSLLEFRQEELPRINSRFEDIQSQIELITDELEKEEEVRGYFEEEYFNIRSKIHEVLSEAKKSSTVHNASIETAVLTNRARLAPIALPTFNGDIQGWESFFDVFKVMVHDDDSFSPSQKFMYLRSALTGPALELVKSVPMTNVNYNIAIEKLRQRYDNQGLVIQAHVRSILNCPSIDVPSAKSFQALHSHICTHLASLRALDQPVEHWDAWLVTIITSRLDRATAHEWQLRQINNKLPRYKDLENFISSRCTAYENSETFFKVSIDHSNSGINKKINGNKRSLVVTETIIVCPFCSGSHRLFRCDKFKAATTTNRLSFAREARLCFNCLSPAHRVDMCKSTYTCVVCNRKHNTLLHLEKNMNNNNTGLINDQPINEDTVAPAQAKESMPAVLFANSNQNHVFLATAIVNLVDKHGHQRKCRAVLDNGSQVNFISRSFLKALQLSSKRVELPVSGIGCSRVHSSAVVEVHVVSRVKNYSISLLCYVLPAVVSTLPPCPISMEDLKIPNELLNSLADPTFTNTEPVDLLIGGGSFYDILEVERVELDIDTVKLQDTKFGWIVTGGLGVTCLLGLASVGEELETDWNAINTNEDGRYGRNSKNNKTLQEEEQVRQHFAETAQRDKDGRFVLRLPMKKEIECIGATYNLAKIRFLNVERKLQQNELLRIEYVKFMDEYLRMNHMEEIINELEVSPQACYLPHHSVTKESSLTTKVRVVFDASAKGTGGHSLNDILLRGPTVQDDVFTILCRFRKHQYVIMADVEKMYRQIKVAPVDCDLQRILWRSAPSDKLKSYRLLRITYGTVPASFMATQCLVALSEEYKQTYPLASKSIREDFYMDDLMTGHETEEGCISLQQQITTILESAKLPLRKWCSNSKFVREKIGKCSADPLFSLEIDNEDIVKSLGLIWKPVNDEFKFNVQPSLGQKGLTKRILLSDLNRVFDPLGFLTPVLIKGKIFLQQLWQIQADWDYVLSEEIQKKWTRYYTDLEELQHVVIPRRAIIINSKQFEVHGFCDASQEAYGACIYIRSLRQDGTWEVQLLCSKSRVAPLKGSTIPRLELNGALCLAHLIKKVSESWKIDCRKCRLWSDSTVVLGWLNAQSACLKTYVANRINQILEITDVLQWQYVNTADNPADIISRGINAQGFKNSKIWWNGPFWLVNDESTWVQKRQDHLPESELPERRILRLALVETRVTSCIIDHYSEWNRLKRGVAWLLRFVEFLKSKSLVSTMSYHSVSELKQAEYWILRRVQAEVFTDEIRALKNNHDLSQRSKLKCLSPFMKNGLIFVGGRLNNADTLKTRIHPIVLPANHKVTHLIVRQKHIEQLHCGPQALLAHVRRQYWPLRSRVIVRSVVLKCVKCIRAKPRFTEPIMAALPKQRVQGVRPFNVVGIDFAGPTIVRSGIRRVIGVKAWIAVFVCFATRAIHLEVVEDLTSNAFLAALRRFISRRGRCTTIFSDNGTNFVGAQRELATFIKKAQPQIAEEGIEWHFNPPAAPHFGGLWESAVKSAKYHLTRMMSNTKLTIGELNTLLCQIEACLNSRPMTPMSSDPSDVEVLTPAHFLIGGSLTLLPEPNLTNENPSHIRRWKYVQLLMQTFWQRWQAEYLPQIQVRGKWTTKTTPLKIHNIVIIKDECMPPASWKLGRIIQIHPGADGIVRVVTVRLASGTEMKRPVVKLCVLPTEDDTLTVENVNFQRGEDV